MDNSEHKENFVLTEKLKKIATQFSNETAAQIKTENNQYKTYTYSEYYKIAENIAYFLIAREIKPNDKIAIVLENCPEWGMIYFGILLCGGIPVPLDTESTLADFQYYFENSECKIVFANSNLSTNLQKIATNILTVENLLTIINSQVSAKTLPQPHENDLAAIVYTSGTTGKPKGVMLTHKNFYSNFKSLEKLGFLFSPQNRENVLSLLPLHHTFPLMATLIIPLFLNCKITYLKSLKSEELIECIKKTKVNALVGVPQLFSILQERISQQLKSLALYIKWPLFLTANFLYFLRRFTKINLSKILFGKIHHYFGGELNYLVSGGAKLDDNVAKFFLKLGFNFYEGYGLTETAPIVTLNLNKIRHLNSPGKPIPDVEIKIFADEILIKGPNVMLGYYKNETATNEVIKDSWFYSGDLGYLDKNNYLHITGRKKDLIVLSSGVNISPEEVENHYKQVKLIKEICILAIQDKTQEKIMAVIVPDFEFCKKNNIFNISGEIKWHLENYSKELPPYKRIMGYIITKDELPHTRLGKVKRYEVQKKYRGELLDAIIGERIERKEISTEEKELLNSPIAKIIISIITNSIGEARNVFPSDHLEIDLGFDSLKKIELVANIEKLLKISIPSELISKITNVKDLILEASNLIGKKEIAEKTTLENNGLSPWKEILKKSLPTEIKNLISLQENLSNKLENFLVNTLLFSFFKIGWWLKIIGSKNIPQDEPLIICANHNSYFDGFLLAAALPAKINKKTFFLGTTDFFANPILKKFLKFLKIIPINPGTELISAMQAVAYVIKNNKIVAIFPEGERSIDGEIKEFKKGVGILAKELNIRVLPAYIQGSFEAWPRGKHFPKLHRIIVIFGKPVDIETLQEIGKNANIADKYEAIAFGIKQKIVATQNLASQKD